MFKDLERIALKQKIIYIFLISIISIILVLTLNKFFINKIKIGSDTYNKIISSKDLVADVLPPPMYIIETRLLSYELLTTLNTKEQKIKIQELQRLEEEFNIRSNYWEKNLTNDYLKKTFNHIKDTGKNYFKILKTKYIPSILNNEESISKMILVGELDNLYKEHRKYVDDLVIFAKNEVNDMERFSKNQETRIFMFILLVNMIVIFVFILALLFILNSIRNSIKNIKKGIESFFFYFNNRNKQPDKIEIKTDDELGEIALLINNNVGTLFREIENNNALLDEVKEIIIKLKKGEFDKKIETMTNDKSLDELKLLINTLINNLQNNYIEILTKENKLIETKELLNMNIKELETIFDISKDGIVLLDSQTNFIYFNNAFSDLTGYSLDELLTKKAKDLAFKEDKESFELILEEVKEKGHVNNFEKRYLRKDDSIIYVNMSIALMPDKDRYLIILKDVTLIKELYEQSKLIAMGEMIGNIAHQWRQPLSVISMISSNIVVLNSLGMTKDNLEKDMNKILEQVYYLSNTIEDFRSFLRKDNFEEKIEISKIMKKCLSLLEVGLKSKNITINSDFREDALILVNGNKLAQAFINIINNSKDALVSNNDEHNRVINIKTKIHDSNNFIDVIIHDNAGGIEESIMSKIFDPYFTTKHQSVGTGLGLSMTYKIVSEMYRGNIYVKNSKLTHNEEKYKGAKFTIRLNTLDERNLNPLNIPARN